MGVSKSAISSQLASKNPITRTFRDPCHLHQLVGPSVLSAQHPPPTTPSQCRIGPVKHGPMDADVFSKSIIAMVGLHTQCLGAWELPRGRVRLRPTPEGERNYFKANSGHETCKLMSAPQYEQSMKGIPTTSAKVRIWSQRSLLSVSGPANLDIYTGLNRGRYSENRIP